jgi:hypothetical protein
MLSLWNTLLGIWPTEGILRRGHISHQVWRRRAKCLHLQS